MSKKKSEGETLATRTLRIKNAKEVVKTLERHIVANSEYSAYK